MRKLMMLLALVMMNAGAFASAGWETDYAAASAKAKAEGKYMVMDFSGSDWCGWCVKLDNEVFKTKAFKSYAAEELVLMLVDFPQSAPQSDAVKMQNNILQKQYQVRGFPTVLILDPEGKLVDKTGYQPGGPEGYIAYIKEKIAADKAKEAPVAK